VNDRLVRVLPGVVIVEVPNVQVEGVSVLLSSVTAPFRANIRPSAVAEVFIVMLVSASTLP